MSPSRSHGNQLEFLTADDWTLINAKAERLTFGLGQEIIPQGSVGNAIYIIRSGEATVQLGGTKDRVSLAVLQSGEICGELAFLDRGMSNVSVLASDEVVEVDAIQANDLRQLCETFGGLGARFYCSLAVVLARRLRERSAELACELNKRDE
jgi:extracellular factor (EF) 3-hydroxypalmitic acid methyl ester biosynthesis protein